MAAFFKFGKPMAKVTKSFQFGNHEVTLETGEIARQASGAVMVSMGGTVVLVTVVAAPKAREGSKAVRPFLCGSQGNQRVDALLSPCARSNDPSAALPR